MDTEQKRYSCCYCRYVAKFEYRDNKKDYKSLEWVCTILKQDVDPNHVCWKFQQKTEKEI